MTALLLLALSLAAALLVGRRLRRVQPPPLNAVPHSVTGPHLGGSVRAELAPGQWDAVWQQQDADRAAIDRLVGAATWEDA